MTTHIKRFVVHAGAAALAVLSCITWFPINGAAQAGNTKAFVAPVVFQAAGPNIQRYRGRWTSFEPRSAARTI